MKKLEDTVDKDTPPHEDALSFAQSTFINDKK